jgi:hypothetical protein
MVAVLSVWSCDDHCLLDAGSRLIVQEKFAGLDGRVFAEHEMNPSSRRWRVVTANGEGPVESDAIRKVGDNPIDSQVAHTQKVCRVIDGVRENKPSHIAMV